MSTAVTARNSIVHRPALTPAAITLLRQITGKSETELQNILHQAKILPTSDENYIKIVEYVRNGQEHAFGIQVVNIIQIDRNNDPEFGPVIDGSLTASEFRMILWHGTKKNFVGPILENGFAPPPDKQQMFGRGIYFADRCSKSSQYCDGTSPGTEGYLFLCDVKVGRMYKPKGAHREYRQTPHPNFDSVKCVGKFIPDWDSCKEIDGVLLPSGETKVNTRFKSFAVQYNEHCVYEPERIKAKYLVVVKFQGQKC